MSESEENIGLALRKMLFRMSMIHKPRPGFRRRLWHLHVGRTWRKGEEGTFLGKVVIKETLTCFGTLRFHKYLASKECTGMMERFPPPRDGVGVTSPVASRGMRGAGMWARMASGRNREARDQAGFTRLCLMGNLFFERTVYPGAISF